MKQEQFMADYFPEGSTVSVDANELQAILRDKAKLTRELEQSKNTIACIRTTLDSLKIVNAALRLSQPIKVKLDIKG